MGFWDFIEHFKGMVKYDNSVVFSGSVGFALIIFSGVLTAISSVTIFQRGLYVSMFIAGILLIVYALHRYNRIEDYLDEIKNPKRKREFKGFKYDLTTQYKRVNK